MVSPLAPPQTPPRNGRSRQDSERCRRLRQTGNHRVREVPCLARCRPRTCHRRYEGSHVIEYLAAGPSAQYAIRTFIVWLIKNKEIAGLEISHRYAATTPLINQQQRLALIQHCIASTAPPLGFRFAGMILLLFGQPFGKIAALNAGTCKTCPRGYTWAWGTYPSWFLHRSPLCSGTTCTTGPTSRPDRQFLNRVALPRNLAGPSHRRRRRSPVSSVPVEIRSEGLADLKEYGYISDRRGGVNSPRRVSLSRRGRSGPSRSLIR